MAAAAEAAAEAAFASPSFRTDVGKQRHFPLLTEAHGTAFYPLLDPPLLMRVLHRVLGAPAVVMQVTAA